MSVRSVRRRLRQRVAEHDWLEGVSVAFGVLFLVGAIACVWAVAITVGTLGDAEPAISDEATILAGSTPGSLQATRWFGIVLFTVLAIIATAVGWFLAGDAVRHVARRVRRRV